MNSIEEKTGHMFNEGIIKQIAAFEAEVKHNLNSSPDYYSYDPEEWLDIDHPFSKYDFIIEDNYWLGIWADFLFLLLVQNDYPDYKAELTADYRDRNDNS